MPSKRLLPRVLLLLLLGAAGCTTRQTAGGMCSYASDCVAPLICNAQGHCAQQCVTDRDCRVLGPTMLCGTGGLCVLPAERDAGPEAGVTEAGADASSDAPAAQEAAADAVTDDVEVGVDGADAAIDGGPDAVMEAGLDAVMEAGLDAVMEAGLDATDSMTAPDSTPATDAPAEAAEAAPDAPDAPRADGAAVPESDCLDGRDNNGDGLVDCADPTCTALVSCVSTGWSDPGTLSEGAVGATAACPAGQTEVFFGREGTSGSPANCTCSCSNPVGSGSCVVPPAANEYTGGGCPPGVPNSSTRFSSACVNSTFVSASFSLSLGLVESGTCTPSGTSSVPPAAGATREARLCAAPAPLGGGCGIGLQCRARPSASPAPGACIARAGEQSCPTAYPERHLHFTGTNDTRACDACTCSYSSAGCDADIVAFSGPNCTGTMLTSRPASSGGCLGGDPQSYSRGATRSSGPGCIAATARPTGCVRDTNPTTVCCAPPAGTATCPTGRGPAMEVLVSSAGTFCIDTTEVTNVQYADFLASSPPTTGQPAECAWNTSFTPSSWPGTANNPVVGVDWCDAVAFCRWAGRSLCGRVDGSRPLNAAEVASPQSQWYQACTQLGTAPVPYGGAINTNLCPTSSSVSAADVFSQSCCALNRPRVYGLLSNVGEWTNSCSGATGSTDTCVATGMSSSPGNCGGSTSNYARSSRLSSLGFRCCAP